MAARAPVLVGGLIGQVIGRLFQAVVATAISTVTGAAIGAALGYLTSSRDSWILGGTIAGGVLGLLSFASAVTVPLGMAPFLFWCLCGVLLPQVILAVPIASYLALTNAGLNPVAAAFLALFVAMPTFVALLTSLVPDSAVSARTLRGSPLGSFPLLKRQADRLLARARRRNRAATLWRDLSRRLGAG
jgi:hypothetical protein